MRGGITQSSIRAVPDVFRRVQFRSIRREKLHMDSPMFRQELLYLLATVDGAPVPEQKEWSTQVLEQFFNKRSYIQACEIPAAKLRVERQASAFGRHSKSTDGRNSILFVEVIENRGFTPRCPICGQRYRFQCSISSSLRCRARRSGF